MEHTLTREEISAKRQAAILLEHATYRFIREDGWPNEDAAEADAIWIIRNCKWDLEAEVARALGVR